MITTSFVIRTAVQLWSVLISELYVLVFQGVFGGAPVSSATLLGVPRADGPPVFADPACRSAGGCTRTFRSSSSDAASALQPDSNPQSPSADNTGTQPRRTSDPLCGGGGATASGQDAGGLAEHVEIVISFDPHDNTASMSSVNSSGSTGSTVRLPAGCGLAPPPILSTNYWSSSATSLCHFPTTAFASSAAADSKPPVLTQSVSSCSLNPPAALLKPSLISNTPYISRHLSASASMTDRHQPAGPPRKSKSERVRTKRAPVVVDERQQSSLDDSDDEELSGGGVCGGSMFRASRGSESTPLLTQHARGRRVDVPSSLICCTPPRHRHVARPTPPMSPLVTATPPLSASSPTDADVAEFCAPAARPKRSLHASLHRRSRRAALINAKHEKWQSIELPDT